MALPDDNHHDDATPPASLDPASLPPPVVAHDGEEYPPPFKRSHPDIDLPDLQAAGGSSGNIARMIEELRTQREREQSGVRLVPTNPQPELPVATSQPVISLADFSLADADEPPVPDALFAPVHSFSDLQLPPMTFHDHDDDAPLMGGPRLPYAPPPHRGPLSRDDDSFDPGADAPLIPVQQLLPTTHGEIHLPPVPGAALASAPGMEHDEDAPASVPFDHLPRPLIPTAPLPPQTDAFIPLPSEEQMRASEASLVVPGYTLGEELGRGPTGVVMRAVHEETGQPVAIKFMLAAFRDAEEGQQFAEEMQALARLDHPGLVRIAGAGAAEGVPYLVEELVEGGTLAQAIDGTPLPVPDSVALAVGVGEAVAAAHRAGVVHGNLKPSNVLFAADGSGKVADFGQWRAADDTGILATGSSYRAPEQLAAGGRGGTAADVYGLGAVLYETLTGHPPFRGPTPERTRELVAEHSPTPPRFLQPDIPEDLEAVVLTCLAKKPTDRYPTVSALVADLRKVGTPQEVSVHTPRFADAPWERRGGKWVSWLAGGSLAALAAAGWLAFKRGGGDSEALQAERNALRAAQDTVQDTKHRLDEANRQLAAAERERDELRNKIASATQPPVGPTATQQNPPPIPVAVTPPPPRTVAELVAAGQFDAANELLRQVPPAARGLDWHLFDRQANGSLRTLAGSTPVAAVALSPDGVLTAVVAGNRVRVIDTRTDAEVAAFDGAATAVAFAPDGKLLAGAADGAVAVYDVAGKAKVKQLPAGGGSVKTLAASRDGRVVAAASASGVRLIDANAGTVTRTLPAGAGVVAVAFQDGRLAVVRPAGTRDLFDTAGDPAGDPLALGGPVESAAFDGMTWLLGGKDGTVRVADAAGIVLHVDRVGAGPVTALAAGADRYVAAAGGTGVQLRDVRPGDAITLPGTRHAANAVAVNAAGDLVAAGGADGKVRVFDAASGLTRATLAGHPAAVVAAAFAPADDVLATAAADGSVVVWDAREGKPSGKAFAVPGPAATFLRFLPDNRLAVVQPERMTVLALDADSKAPAPLNAAVRAVSAGGTRAVVRDAAGAAQLVTLPAGTRQPLPAAAGAAHFTFAPNGHRLYAAADAKVIAWTVADGAVAYTEPLDAAVTGLAASPDGGTLVVGLAGRPPRLLDARTGKPLVSAMPGPRGLTAAAFAPDAKLIAAAGPGGTVELVYPSGSAADREALARLHRPGVDPKTIAGDVTLSPAAKARAVAIVGGRVDTPPDVRKSVQTVVLDPKASPAAVAEALRAVEAALEGDAKNAEYLSLQGAALYRSGQYRPALSALQRKPAAEQTPRDLAFLAMAQAKLNRKGTAAETLKRLQAMMGQEPWSKQADAKALATEAAGVVEGR